MPGGLLNLITENTNNYILTGNPKKTFFSTTYSKYTNFGMQKIRLNYEGLRTLRMSEDSVFSFNIPRHADLLMDTYFVVTLPNIWSPIRQFYPPLNTELPYELVSRIIDDNKELKIDPITRNFWPYEFKWIENLGSQMIKNVRYSIGGNVIQEFTGQYLYNMVQRDFTAGKKELFDEMTGNTKELNDPANYGGRNNNYPNAIYNEEWITSNSDTLGLGAEPSIRGRKIYVPLNIWSTLNTKLAFPLISLQYESLNIEITCRPVQELFVVRYQPTRIQAQKYCDLQILINTKQLHNYSPENDEDIKRKFEAVNNIGNYVQPNQGNPYYHMYRFLHPPNKPTQKLPIKTINDYENNISNSIYYDVDEENISNGNIIQDNRDNNGTIDIEDDDINDNINTNTNWNSDIHLLANYVFLGDEERNRFAREEQSYLIKEIHEKTHYNKTGNNLIDLDSQGLVSSWMWFFQRSDVNLRNEWSNYSNWDYNTLPYKGISNIIGNDYYKKDYIPRHYYDHSNFTINSNILANWDNVSINNFALHILDINDLDRSAASDDNFNASFLEGDEIFNRLKGEQTINIKRINDTNKRNTIKINYDNLPNPYLISGPVHNENIYNIMTQWGLKLNGKYRENLLDSGILNYVEKYTRTSGNAKSGLYCYNFTLNTSPFVYQPSGAINLSKFNLIQFETSTIVPPQKDNVQVNNIKDVCGNIIGINKPTWNLFKYNYNIHIMEERYNILKFNSGMAGLVFSK